MSHLLCFFSPSGCVLTSIAKATFGDFFNALTGWIMASVQWLFSASGKILTSVSDPQLVMRASSSEYSSLETVSPALLLVGLLVGTIHALRLGEPARLWRDYFGVLPACVAGIFVARPLAQLLLEIVNQLCSSASSGVAGGERQLVVGLTALTASVPGFGLFVIASGLAVGTWLLWCELIVRNVVLALLIVSVPLVVPLALFASARRIAWRLLETFLAVAASKLVIVMTLNLGLAEVRDGSATAIVTGLVTLLLASASPFVLLRLLPVMEYSSLHALEGLRTRATRSAVSAGSSPLASAVDHLRPDVPAPEEGGRGEDLGLETWPGSPERGVPDYDGEPVAPPIGQAQALGGHRHVYSDDKGPVIGWHFDE
ncbi:MAG TPA: hypothetical protein VNE22_03840 [Acidimicrobiales bacterium]|nr:hypothetical protein [Acidimicrobiales bacterium]